ncbi:hypothetical protein [uncultured Aliiroseovarius sp.]|uniref:hypothetical protein n=1 Tax=uncultured Aliiroseovarius sp. TaxID=1658783 RepID=UPI002631BB52|nr:hypothetical protein [uncultured Aliiroseovarius sp.]
MTDASTSLFSEILEPGTLESGTPHSRAQNFMAHVGLAMILTVSFGALGLSATTAALVVIATGIVWEVRGILIAERTLKLAATRKSIVDVVSYSIGATFVTIEESAITLVFGALALAGSYLAANPNLLSRKGED